MAEGILSAMTDCRGVIMAERRSDRATELKRKYAVKVTPEVTDVIKAAKLVFLAVRPQDVEGLAASIKPLLTTEHTLVSIVAGKTLKKLHQVFGRKVRLVRVMPNLALRAQAGMCAICPERAVSPQHLKTIQTILGNAGAIALLSERHFDAVTALSGSGPAYFAYMEAAMAEGGVKLGLPPRVARLLAEQTMFGTAKFLRESQMDLNEFINGVCTKGGTTAAGMRKLATPNFKRIVAATLKAAAQRSAELAAVALTLIIAPVFADDAQAPSAEVETSSLKFDAGADLRIRQELTENVPGLPGGGVLNANACNQFRNHMRFRPRVWGEISGDAQSAGKWRLFTRFTDEFRWCPEPYVNTSTFPDEVILDNLFIEGKGIFDGKLDMRVGRQDLMGYLGLNHVFVDGTPGDGSRSVYTDMAAFKWHVDEVSTIDLFALYNFDDNILRWGTDRCKHRSLTGLGGGAESEMDDWGYGIVWGSRVNESLPYQVFIIQKNTMEFERDGVTHPWTQRELIGTKWVPQLNAEWSLQMEGMGQVGCNGEGDTLSGWSSYLGANWQSAEAGSWRPFGKLGYHFMSGDDDAATEDGGHSAWDPMWARGVNDSEMFLYGTHYGAGWWSNMHYVKLTGGWDLGARHKITGSCGPMFAAAQDGLGGGDGMFKGFLYQGRYDFPLRLADKSHGERFEMFGHLMIEMFHPGDYFYSEKPAFMFRWQLEMKF